MAPLITGFDLPPLTKIKGCFEMNVGQKEDGSLRYFAEGEFVPFPDFKLEMAKKGNGGQFSIKSCYDNKYMVLEGPDSIILTMGSAEPNEDPSQWSCTLFEAVDVQDQSPDALSNPDGPVIQLRFVHSQKLVSMCIPSDGSCDNIKLGVQQDENSKVDYCVVPNYFTFVKSNHAMTTFPVSSLPRFVKLVVDSRYVGHDKEGSLKLYEANVAAAVAVNNNQFELEEAKIGGGWVNIKSRTSNKYWVLAGPDSIFLKAAADQPNEDRSHWSCTLFQPVDYEPHTDGTDLAFRFVHSNQVVVRHHEPGVNDDGTSLVGIANKLNPHSSTDGLFVQAVDCGSVPVQPKHPYDSFRYVVLRCNYNKKYLHQTNKVDNGFADGSIRGDGEDPLSPNCKFELERPKAADHHKGFCHIRSCFNNKYLTMEGGIIKAVANKPKEAGSSQVEEEGGNHHTLFELVHVAEDRIQLRFVHSQGLVAYSRFTKSLFQTSEDEGVANIKTELTVYDWEKFVILPRYVAFKGDNGKYLSARHSNDQFYLEFDSSDIGDPAVAHEITYSPDRLSVRIMSTQLKKFWDNTDEWICPTSDDDTKRSSTFFVPIKTPGNTIVLRSLANKKFCKRSSTGSLWADADTFGQSTYMTVEETISKRRISNVNYRLAEARIYDENIKTMVTREATNHHSEKETVQLRLLYQQKASSTWTVCLSASQKVEAEFKCGLPLVVDTGLKVSLGFEESYSWGETTETTSDVETTHVVTVPEHSRVQVRLIATEGKCDVPFSYVVHDTLLNGDEITHQLDGGMYTGVGNYNFQYHTHKLPLLDDDGSKDPPRHTRYDSEIPDDQDLKGLEA